MYSVHDHQRPPGLYDVDPVIVLPGFGASFRRMTMPCAAPVSGAGTARLDGKALIFQNEAGYIAALEMLAGALGLVPVEAGETRAV